MIVQRMPNILQYVLQYALAVSYRIAIRLQPQYPPLEISISVYIVFVPDIYYSFFITIFHHRKYIELPTRSQKLANNISFKFK